MIYGAIDVRLTSEKKQVLFENTVYSTGGATKDIQERHIVNCNQAHPADNAGVAKGWPQVNLQDTLKNEV